MNIATKPTTAYQKEVSLTQRTYALVAVVLLGAITAAEASAGDIGHFVPGAFKTHAGGVVRTCRADLDLLIRLSLEKRRRRTGAVHSSAQINTAPVV